MLDATACAIPLKRGEAAGADLLPEFVQRLAALDASRDLLGDLLYVGAELCQHRLALLDAVEIERLERTQGGGPFVREPVPHVGQEAVHQVASRHHALGGDERHDVARCMGPAQEEEVDLPAAAVNDEPLVERHRGQRDPRRSHLL
jgi:hypothetical protein